MEAPEVKGEKNPRPRKAKVRGPRQTDSDITRLAMTAAVTSVSAVNQGALTVCALAAKVNALN